VQDQKTMFHGIDGAIAFLHDPFGSSEKAVTVCEVAPGKRWIVIVRADVQGG
jgi:hypothetical protein